MPLDDSSPFITMPMDAKIASISWLKLDKRKIGVIARIFAYTTYDDNESCLYFRMHKIQEEDHQITPECGSISVNDLLQAYSSFPSTTYNHFTSTTPTSQQSQQSHPQQLLIHQNARLTHIQSLTPNLLLLGLSTGGIALVQLKINVSTHGLDHSGEFLHIDEFIDARIVHFITLESQSRFSTPHMSYDISSMDYITHSKVTNNSLVTHIQLMIGIGGILYGINWQAPQSYVNHLKFESSSTSSSSKQHNDNSLLYNHLQYNIYSLCPSDYFLLSTQQLPSSQHNNLTTQFTQFTPITSLQLTSRYIAVSLLNSRFILFFSTSSILSQLNSHQPHQALSNLSITPPLILSPPQQPQDLSTFFSTAFVPTSIAFPFNRLHSENTMSTQLVLAKNLSSTFHHHHHHQHLGNTHYLFCFDPTTSSLHIFNPSPQNFPNFQFDSINQPLEQQSDDITNINPTPTSQSLLPQLILPLLFSPFYQHHPCTRDSTTNLDILYSRPPTSMHAPLHTFQPLIPSSIEVYPGIHPLDQSLLSMTSDGTASQVHNVLNDCTILLHTKNNHLFSIDLSELLSSNAKKYSESQLIPSQFINISTQQHAQQTVRFVPIKQLYPSLPVINTDDAAMVQMTTGINPTQQTTQGYANQLTTSAFSLNSSSQSYNPLFINHPFVEPSLLTHFNSSTWYAYDPSSTCTLLVSQDYLILCPRLQQQQEKQ